MLSIRFCFMLAAIVVIQLLVSHSGVLAAPARDCRDRDEVRDLSVMPSSDMGPCMVAGTDADTRDDQKLESVIAKVSYDRAEFLRLLSDSIWTVPSLEQGGTTLGGEARDSQADRPPVDSLTVQATGSLGGGNLSEKGLRFFAHSAIVMARSVVDLTYESLVVEPGSNALVVSGTRLYPLLDWTRSGWCEVSIDRVIADGTMSFDRVSLHLELSGVKLPPDCFAADIEEILTGWGLEEVTVDAAMIEIAYFMADSAAEVLIEASVRDMATVTAEAMFDYLWFWFSGPDSDLEGSLPVALLRTAEIRIENNGLLDHLEPVIKARFGSLDVVPKLARLAIVQHLTEAEAGEGESTGFRSPTDDELAFADNVSKQFETFFKERTRLVLTAAPDGGAWLDRSVFSSLEGFIASLAPTVSGTAAAYQPLISPEEVAAALEDGASPSDATRLRVGTALLTGLGAPRSLDAGTRLLLPVAQNWSGEAAAILASSYESAGLDAEAYEMALIALASGETGSLGVADRLEQRLPLENILLLQADVGRRWPRDAVFGMEFDVAISTGDIAAIRRFADSAATGIELPRSYAAAYMLATLAAVGGDRGAESLRRRLDSRFGGEPKWRRAARDAENSALAIWLYGGLGAAITGVRQ